MSGRYHVYTASLTAISAVSSHRSSTHFADNFIKIHSTLRTSPAMVGGVNRLFDVSDLVALMVESEKKAA